MRYFTLLLLVFISVNVSYAGKPDKKEKKPKNIIFLIGDGMGTAQMYASMTVLRDNTNMYRFPYVGLIKTYSADNYITDSAAGGTAFSTGTKTNNGYIAVGTDGKPLTTILELAEQKGLSTGLVATACITHATPASFIAHNSSRGNYEDIAKWFLKTDIDVFIGGGYNHFAMRSDSLNLIDSLVKKGYFVTRDIGTIDPPTMNKVAALVADVHLPKIADGRGNMLPNYTKLAINTLKKNKKGFFVMIEGSQIDWGGHDTSLNYIIDETIDFDKAIGKALDFAQKDGNTLVVVTADHETGGLGLTGGSIKDGKVEGHFIWNNHTAVMVPVYAYGPGAEYFTGIYENTDIFKKMVMLLDLLPAAK